MDERGAVREDDRGPGPPEGGGPGGRLLLVGAQVDYRNDQVSDVLRDRHVVSALNI